MGGIRVSDSRRVGGITLRFRSGTTGKTRSVRRLLKKIRDIAIFLPSAHAFF